MLEKLESLTQEELDARCATLAIEEIAELIGDLFDVSNGMKSNLQALEAKVRLYQKQKVALEQENAELRKKLKVVDDLLKESRKIKGYDGRLS